MGPINGEKKSAKEKEKSTAVFHSVFVSAPIS